MTENTLGNCQQPARIELYQHTRHELSLRGLSEFEYCWVLSFFHLNQGFNPLVTPPRGPRKKQGVFATRSPHRPNSIGLSCIRITSVDEAKGIIHLLGVDLLDGTAVLDVKPCTFLPKPNHMDTCDGLHSHWCFSDMPFSPCNLTQSSFFFIYVCAFFRLHRRCTVRRSVL